MDPLPSFGTVVGASQPSSGHLALLLAQPGLGAPGLTMATSAELDEELQRILASLYQGVEEALKEQLKSANKVDQQLRDKGNELREWHGKQFQVLMKQQETISMARKDVIAREARMAERKALLDAREQDISSREEKLEATLRAKDDDLEALVQQHTKELDDKHKATLDALIANSATQLKKLADDLAAASSAKADLDQQVTKLSEELAGSAKEISTLKEEAQKAEILLKDIQSQLSSKSQDLESANGTIEDQKARIDTLESSAESSGAREQQLTKDLDIARRLRKDAEDKLENHSEQVDL
nr:myosin-11-like [Aegilops tauschii subsp. strangulata]